MIWGGEALSLTISGRQSRPLIVGDTYTLWRPERGIEDVTVKRLTQGGGGWIAYCEIAELAPP